MQAAPHERVLDPSGQGGGRTIASPQTVIASAFAVLMLIGATWRLSDLKFSGLPIGRGWDRAGVTMLGLSIAGALLVALGVFLADAKLASISNVRPGTRHAAEVPRLLQAAMLVFLAAPFSWIAEISGPMLALPAERQWLPHVIMGVPQLVFLYYFANRLIDIDMLRPDVRPWFVTTMVVLGSAGSAVAKFFPEATGPQNARTNQPGVTVPLIIFAVFALVGMSYRRPAADIPPEAKIDADPEPRRRLPR